MKNKSKQGAYASCLPDLSCLRNRQVAAAATGSARRATSVRSDRGGFITIENSVAEMDAAEEGAGFITMEEDEKPCLLMELSEGAAALDVDKVEDEKPCLLMELSEGAAAFDVDKVEDEFLTMLEDTYRARSKEIDKGLSVTLDLDSLIKDAEMELAKAEQAWKSKVGGAIVEEEEYKELVRRWRGFGFGSPDRPETGVKYHACSMMIK
jgi:hypothetical protein